MWPHGIHDVATLTMVGALSWSTADEFNGAIASEHGVVSHAGLLSNFSV